jgi:viroplasmin and RNaseH domain-containing protein
MTRREYREKVISFFRSGKATKEQWKEVGDLILKISESSIEKEIKSIEKIDRKIDPEFYKKGG